MIKKIADEIRSHWKKGESTPLSITNEIEILFERGSLNVITLKLNRGEYSAEQELVMGKEADVSSQILSEDFLDLLKRRFESLEDSLDDM